MKQINVQHVADKCTVLNIMHVADKCTVYSIEYNVFSMHVADKCTVYSIEYNACSRLMYSVYYEHNASSRLM